MNVDAARRRIRAHNLLNAFVSLTAEQGEGTIVGVKDVIDVRGSVTTAGSTILPNTQCADDAAVVSSLRHAGCLVVGKTNLHEFAFGVTSANPHYGSVVNPRAPERIPGGSSGGSAAAVAAGLVDWALGTDTGGSIRIPAALCGVVGFKPTIGLIDTTGVVPLSRSLDTLGPLAPDVQTAAAAFAQMQGQEPGEDRSFGPGRLAVIDTWGDDLDAESAIVWKRVTEGLPSVKFPPRKALNEVGFTVLLAEAAAFHRHWLETVPERYGRDVLEALQRGLAITRREYVAALLEQSRLRIQADAAMEEAEVDVLVVPATRIRAPLIGQPFERFDLTGYTRPFNTTGQPAICLPAPHGDIPIGIQLVGRHGDDLRLLAVARSLERQWAISVSSDQVRQRRGVKWKNS